MKAKRPGGARTIGVFSPSSPVSATAPARYARGAAYLESKGYRVVHGALYGARDAYRSGSIQARADEFNRLLRDDAIDILMAAIGGNNTNSILPYIDYDYLRAHPKPIVGYSDVTALLLGVYARTGLVTFYGPALAASFGEFPPFVDWTFARFDRMMRAEPRFPCDCEMPDVWTDEFIDWQTQDRGKAQYANAWICARPGKCRGRLIGGNLNTMEGFLGTPYMPEMREGDILLIEDSLKDAQTIERSFSLLKLAGILDRVGGIVLGKHEKFDDNGTGRRPHEILLQVLGGRGIPILADFDCCHTHPMLTLPIGCEAELDATNLRLTLLESPFA